MLGSVNLLSIALVAVLIATIVWIVKRCLFWLGEMRKLQTTGYLPPEPSVLARVTHQLVTRLLTLWYVGPVRAKGKENVPASGRVFYAPIHILGTDFAVILTALPFTLRVLRTCASSSELRGLNGFLAAWTGTWGINKDEPHEARLKAIDAAARSLVPDPTDPHQGRNNTLLWFPQGLLWKLHFDEEGKLVKLTNLKGGSASTLAETLRGNYARVALQAAKEAGSEPVYLLPIGIHYKQDLSRASWFFRLLERLGINRLRCMRGEVCFGANVAIGKPILIAPGTLPMGQEEACKFMADALHSLVEEARSMD